MEVFDGTGQIVQHPTGIPLCVFVSGGNGIKKVSSLEQNNRGTLTTSCCTQTAPLNNLLRKWIAALCHFVRAPQRSFLRTKTLCCGVIPPRYRRLGIPPIQSWSTLLSVSANGAERCRLRKIWSEATHSSPVAKHAASATFPAQPTCFLSTYVANLLHTIVLGTNPFCHLL